MLHSLKNTGLNARLTTEKYHQYLLEIAELESKWQSSLKMLDYCDFKIECGIPNREIPIPIWQFKGHHTLYDYRVCKVLKTGSRIPEGFETIYTGGTVPCALFTILEYWGKAPETLSELAKVLVQNGYRTRKNGTLWIAMDKVTEIVYGLESRPLSHMIEVFQEVSLGHPVLAIAPAAWLHGNPNYKTNECFIIWRIQEERWVVVTTTSSEYIVELELYDVLRNIKRCWTFTPVED